MVKITFIAANGAERTVETPDGTSIMEAATGNLVPGIDGDCGGEAACATCHVYIRPEWADRLPPIGSQEETMLGVVDGRKENSRLGCQITLGEELDGLVAELPLAQH
ncbi:2Fe-2S iron-sulfur cluster-binding protein [Algiphilus aromaticivorans]|jgi:2Fe-2S ferredoxin|uniref:2Fe-2S iron-sulfur cluster-binding protein n=1 Tax=Algiphilus aromaticivorans TaxID=382454 RepID=UPI0005C198B5|nr:2Fe-2S iron-sulfur cluster-binding protein [Algiphilus aromaticivorans]